LLGIGAKQDDARYQNRPQSLRGRRSSGNRSWSLHAYSSGAALTVFLILMILPVAWVMMSLPEGLEQTRMLVLHRSLGVTIFAVVVLRLAWRLAHPPPPLLCGTPRVMELISQITHWLLYALLGLIPVTGYLQSGDGRQVSYFGLFNLPGLPQDKALGDTAKVLHLLGQWGIYTLVGLHVGATVWHVAI
jgi:cytochrome b561